MQRCENVYSKFNIKLSNESQICAGGEKGRDSCSGDSGNPFVKALPSEIGNRYFIIGIVSFGTRECGKSDKEAIYTRVSHYLPWILNKIKNNLN